MPGFLFGRTHYITYRSYSRSSYLRATIHVSTSALRYFKCNIALNLLDKSSDEVDVWSMIIILGYYEVVYFKYRRGESVIVQVMATVEYNYFERGGLPFNSVMGAPGKLEQSMSKKKPAT